MASSVKWPFFLLYLLSKTLLAFKLTAILSVLPLTAFSYEITYALEHLLDPEFNISVAVGKIWLEMARDLADSLVLPFNLTDSAIFLEEAVNDLNKKLSGKIALYYRLHEENCPDTLGLR